MQILLSPLEVGTVCVSFCTVMQAERDPPLLFEFGS